MARLIKLSEEHYIVVDNSEIKNGDFVYSADGGIFKRHIDNPCQTVFPISKITHSTQPIEEWKSVSYGGDGTIRKKIYDKIKPLSLSEVKELIGEVNVEKKAEERYPIIMRTVSKIGGGTYDTDVNFSDRYSYKKGYNQALEDNKDRKYTDEDVKNALFYALYHPTRDGDISITKDSIVRKTIQSIQPTRWEVEIVNGKLKLK